MSNKCIYSERFGCKECNQIFYRNCPKFNKAWALSLVKEILPFTAVNIKDVPKSKVYYSASDSFIKTICAKYSISKGFQVKRLTLSQVMSIIIDREEFTFPKVVYLECKTKPLGDNEKVLSVFNAFVDQCLYNGTKVFILSKIPYLKSADWVKI